MILNILKKSNNYPENGCFFHETQQFFDSDFNWNSQLSDFEMFEELGTCCY
jgi:hypothetical protein